MTGKYTPLEHYLRDLPETQKEVTLTFERIEMAINDKMPLSASKHREWWANEKEGQHTHAHSWMNAGWRVDTVNLEEKWVRFVRE